MKRCPNCKKDYFDQTLEFCLDDGSRLTNIDAQNNETVTLNRIDQVTGFTNDKTVQFDDKTIFNNPNIETAKTQKNQNFSDKKEIIKQNISNTTQRTLEISPIVLALAHNYWQWLYLSKQPTYNLTDFFTSVNFLIWLFLLFGGALFGLFSLKYGKNKGFAITALVVMAINVILSIVPK